MPQVVAASAESYVEAFVFNEYEPKRPNMGGFYYLVEQGVCVTEEKIALIQLDGWIKKAKIRTLDMKSYNNLEELVKDLNNGRVKSRFVEEIRSI